MAPVVRELQQHPNIQTIVCVTAQHRRMLDDALSVFDINPQYDLNIMRSGQTLGSITAAVLNGLTPILQEVKPHRVLVHGDTTTTFASALACFYCGIPVGHVEAGLRTGNLMAPWPEEFNRRVSDIVADLLWAPTTRSAEALRREGAEPRNVKVTGNTVIDALLHAKSRLEREQDLRKALEKNHPDMPAGMRLILVTGHRRENFENGLAAMCVALNQLAMRSDVAVVWPLHPNPTVVALVKANLGVRPNVHIIPPQDYLSFVLLMMRSTFIITDSGGIQEEAPALGKPVLVTRDETERPEALEAGTAELVGTSSKSIVEAANRLLDDPSSYDKMSRAHNPFGDGRAAQRIVQDILQRHDVDAP